MPVLRFSLRYYLPPAQSARAGSAGWLPFSQPAASAVRTELLKSLGQAFGIQGMQEAHGQVKFSQDFMDKLQQVLGPELKRGDFGISADGLVTSGKPLTQRHISAIINRATTVGTPVDFSIDDYQKKTEFLIDKFNASPKAGRTPAVRNHILSIQSSLDLLKMLNTEDPATHRPYEFIKPGPKFNENSRYVFQYPDDGKNRDPRTRCHRRVAANGPVHGRLPLQAGFGFEQSEHERSVKSGRHLLPE